MSSSIELPAFASQPGDLLSLKTGADDEENFRKYVLPQRHKLLRKLQRKDEGCVMVRGLPFGITQKNLKQYMQQFGEVIQCYLHRCPKSGKTKGYGYVHFKYSNVAAVATTTMNNYLLLGNIIKCTLIPGGDIKEKFFTAKDPKYHQRVNDAVRRVNKRRDASREELLLKKRQRTARRQLAKLGPALTAADVAVETKESSKSAEKKVVHKKRPSTVSKAKSVAAQKKESSKSAEKKVVRKKRLCTVSKAKSVPAQKGVIRKKITAKKTTTKSPKRAPRLRYFTKQPEDETVPKEGAK